MIKSAIEKLIKSILSGNIYFSNDLNHNDIDKANSFVQLIKPNSHRCLEFATIVKGQAVLCLDSTAINIHQNQAWVILPQTLHCEAIADKKGAYVLLWTIIISRGVNFFLSEYSASNKNRLSTNRLFVEFPQAKDLWEVSRNPMLSKSLSLRAQCVSLLLMACVQGLDDANNAESKSAVWTTSHQKLVQQIKDYIKQHCRENLSISELSAFAGYTPNHLSLLFKRYTNQSIHQYLIQVKLKLAEELLTTGKHQVKEVAFLTGFNDPLYFSRVFKKKFGCPPSEYLATNATLPQDIDPKRPA